MFIKNIIYFFAISTCFLNGSALNFVEFLARISSFLQKILPSYMFFPQKCIDKHLIILVMDAVVGLLQNYKYLMM